jgi:glutathione S-transferase
MTTAAPTLYESKGSPNARRVRIFIAEKGIDIPTKPVDLGAKEQFSDAYRAINPRSQVPALALVNGPVIAEVLAIWRYLEEAYPQTPLLGSTARSKALVTMWERRAELDGFSPVMEGVRNAVAGLKGRALSGPHAYDQIPELIARSNSV